MTRKLYSDTAVSKLLYPSFENIIIKLSKRNPPSSDRIKKFIHLNRLICNNLKHLTTFDELNNVRVWRELKIRLSPAGKDSARIFTQDLNKVLALLHKSGHIRRITLKPEKRKFVASGGVHVDKLLDFNSSDIATLWSFISSSHEKEFVLLFMLTLSACMPVKYLLQLKVADIHKNWISVSDASGLVYGTLIEPGRTMLLRYIFSMKLNKNDNVFSNFKSSNFNRWLKKHCTLAFVPVIDIHTLFYYARFICVVQGIPAYQILSIGSKNAFSPFSNPETMEEI